MTITVSRTYEISEDSIDNELSNIGMQDYPEGRKLAARNLALECLQCDLNENNFIEKNFSFDGK